jgi:hypothetical protein
MTDAPLPAPKRGGIHSVYGLFIGGSPLDDDYNAEGVYSYTTQRRNAKGIASIEHNLTTARDSITSQKFNGKLEPVISSSTEIGKERFLTLLQRRVEEHGQETFYYLKDNKGKVVNMLTHVHSFTLEMVVNEFKHRKHADTTDGSAFDTYEKDEITMSRLVVESLLTAEFYDKIFIRYGHQDDFKKLSGACLLAMALETCNASASLDVDEATAAFNVLTLDSYPGENVADLMNKALKLVKIMKTGPSIPNNTGSRLLQKVTKTSCEEFNRKVFTLLDDVKNMEHKYKMLTPDQLLTDSDYDKLGPIGLISTLHDIYGRLVTDRDWPALADKLPQSNNAPAAPASRPAYTGSHDIRCFRCGGPHHIKDCPKLRKTKDKVDKSDRGDKDTEPLPKKPKTELPAWRYAEPKDLTKPLVDEDGRKWKFCTKCVCHKSGKTGLYLLSHFDSEHQDNFAPSSHEGNMAAYDAPFVLPPDTFADDDPLEFHGAWCVPVSNDALAHSFPVVSTSVEREMDVAEVSTTEPTQPTPVLEAPPFRFVPPSVLPSTFPTALALIQATDPGLPHALAHAIATDWWLALESEIDTLRSIGFLSPSFESIPTDEPCADDSIDADDDIFDVSTTLGFQSDENGMPIMSDSDTDDSVLDGTEFLTTDYDVPDVSSSEIVRSDDEATLEASDDKLYCPCRWRQCMISTFGFIMIVWQSFCSFINRTGYDNELLSSVKSHMTIGCSYFSEVVFQPHIPFWIQQFMRLTFWISMIVWESISYFTDIIGFHDEWKRAPRRERRRIDKRNWKRRHDHGRRLPDLVFLPAFWMVLTNTVMFPMSGQSFGNLRETSWQIVNFGKHAYNRIVQLDDMMVLNMDTLIQFHKLKASHLMHQLLGPLSKSTNDEVATAIPLHIVTNFDLVADCCVFDSTDEVIEVVYLPAERKSSLDNTSKRQCKNRNPTILDRCIVDETDTCEFEVVWYLSSSINQHYEPQFRSASVDETCSPWPDGCVPCFDTLSRFDFTDAVSPDRTNEQERTTPWSQELASMSELLYISKSPMANGPTTVVEEDVLHAMGSFNESCVFMNFATSSKEKHPVIFDTGASLAITFDKADFDGPLTVPKGDLRLGGMANGLKIEGVGSVTWTFANCGGEDVCVRGLAYYVPQAKARLLSPQRLFDASTGLRGRYEGDHKSFRLHLDGSSPLTIEYDDRNSLPIGYARFGADVPFLENAQMNLTIIDDANQNLTGGQKLLLQWHYRFGHLNLPAVQRILRAVPFLSEKFAAASKCDAHSLKCSICEYAKGHRRAKKNVTQVVNAERDGALKIDSLRPGLQVSVDHFESRVLGRTFDSFGKASSATYKGGCIFVDHCSGFMFVEPQLGFSAVESIRAKQVFEQNALQYGVIIESYLTDSGAFKANAFVKHIREHEQLIRYCGANAHHKNGVAERGVQSVSNMARALMLHASSHWKDGIDASLWPMAVQYATYLYNHLPNAQGLCPADLFTGSTIPRHRLKDIHVWGCPVYVLDPQLQAGQKLPRWQPRSRRAVFMGFSHLHSSDVPLVLNLETGSITPQYHVVFDDHFSTVSSVEREMDPPDHWAELCLENTTYIPHDSLDDTDAPNALSPNQAFDFEWMSPEDREWAHRALTRQDVIRDAFQPSQPSSSSTAPPSTSTETSSSDSTTLISSSASTLGALPAISADLSHPSYAQVVTTSRSSPAPPIAQPASQPPIALSEHQPQPATTTVSISPSLLSRPPATPAESSLRRSSRSTKGTFQQPRYIDEAFLSSMHTTLDSAGHSAQLAYLAELFTCSDTGVVNITDPRVYSAKTPGSDSDMPTLQQAMNGPAASEYIEAMRLEIQTLMSQHTWETVSRPKDKTVLKGTWAFKLKRLPDGTPYRYKARFCARGDMQTEGVDFFETYAPVVHWSTIRLLLSTVLTEGWTTRQVDYTNAFAQAELREEVYVECPRLFGPKSGTDKVLRLLKSLYGLRQAPRTFFEKLKAGLEEREWKQSEIDPCLFLKSGMMCVVYVDDTIFASANGDDLEQEILSLGISTNAQRHTFELRNEGEVSAFLGIQIQKTGSNEFLLTQTGLIDKVLAVTNMTDCNGCDTPATLDPLHADKDGEPFTETWGYDVVIGMLMYLSGNTRPDIAYSVHQAARFTHGARKSHANGVKRILRYLKKTKTQGLILKPGPDHRVDCYVDADFGGLFSVEDKQDPVSVKSRTGYVITYRGAPLMWASKMQTQVALSTMEAEYIALSQSMRDLIPIREVLKEIMTIVFEAQPTITYHSHSKAFADTVGTSPHVIPQSTVYEDNDACLKFARMPKLTPRTKHIGIPYHWFRTQVERLEIHIESIDTHDQLGDQFTKGLPVDSFRRARERLMGW